MSLIADILRFLFTRTSDAAMCLLIRLVGYLDMEALADAREYTKGAYLVRLLKEAEKGSIEPPPPSSSSCKQSRRRMAGNSPSSPITSETKSGLPKSAC